jgi:hypothetical protein
LGLVAGFAGIKLLIVPSLGTNSAMVVILVGAALMVTSPGTQIHKIQKMRRKDLI